MQDSNAEGNSLEQQNNENAHPLPHLSQQSLRCANCDIDILWLPIITQGKTYCCTGCAAGGPCNCDYSQYRSVTISGVVHYKYPD
ncbi:MAG: hypothetical protein ABI406_13805 [Ktedonobacteraceae bacterium]